MQQIDFSQGSIRRRILAVATPMLIAQLLNLLYNIVDRIYIGKIPGEGTLALASIGLCFPFVTLITAFANLFGLGGAPLCAMARGKGNREGAQGIMVNAGFMLLLSGAVLTVLGIAFHRPLLYLFGASEVTYPYASSYIVIYLLGTLCVMLSLGLNPYINCQGFARTGMLTVALGRKIRGYDTADALLTGPETRTSSPVRMTRGEDLFGLGCSGIIPCGEGAGYAGGIMSAAVDGIRAAFRIMEEFAD